MSGEQEKQPNTSQPVTPVVLSGGFFCGEDGLWRSSTFERCDCGPLGSFLRVKAGMYLYQTGNCSRVVTSGGRGECEQFLPEGLTLSAILKSELEEYGIPTAAILEESLGNSTYQQLQALLLMRESLELGKLAIISSEHHLPRIEAMLEYKSELASLRENCYTVSAEEVVFRYEPHWRVILDEAYQKEPLRTLIEKEKRGVAEIKQGTYRFR